MSKTLRIDANNENKGVFTLDKSDDTSKVVKIKTNYNMKVSTLEQASEPHQVSTRYWNDNGSIDFLRSFRVWKLSW